MTRLIRVTLLCAFVAALAGSAVAEESPKLAFPVPEFSDYPISTAVAFFILPLVFTLFFGRTFCASVCPLGAIQELIAIRPVAVPGWMDHSFGPVAYVYLGAAVIRAATRTGSSASDYEVRGLSSGLCATFLFF